MYAQLRPCAGSGWEEKALATGIAVPVDREPSASRTGSPLVSPLISRHMMLEDWERHMSTPEGGKCISLDGSGLPDFVPLEDGAGEPGLLSVGESVFNLVNTMVGCGALSVPYAFQLSGYASAPLLLLVVMVTAFTATLIGEALDLASAMPEAALVPRHHRDYAFLAQVAFGVPGRACVGVATLLELWLAVVTLLVMNGLNAQLIFGVENHVAIVACAVLAAVMIGVPMRAYAYVSLLSLFFLICATGIFLVYLLTLPSWALPPVGIAPAAFGDVPRSIGIMLFCFAGHPCFPTVHESMRETYRWNESVRISFFASFGYYGCLGLFAYSALGSELQPSFVENIVSQDAWRTTVALLFLLKVQLTLPLLLRVILAGTRLHEGGGPGVPVLLVAGTAASACFFAEDLASLATLCGSLLVMLTSVLIPAAIYLRLWVLSGLPWGSPAGTMMALGCLAVCLFGFGAGVSGTYFAVTDMTGGGLAARGT